MFGIFWIILLISALLDASRLLSHGSTLKNAHEGDGLVESNGSLPNQGTLAVDMVRAQ